MTRYDDALHTQTNARARTTSYISSREDAGTPIGWSGTLQDLQVENATMQLLMAAARRPRETRQGVDIGAPRSGEDL